MISELHIENIAVIKNLTVDFKKGFSVLTGETGAGKSIIIDSVNLLLGARSARELIRTGEDHALVSARFDSLSKKTEDELKELDIYPDDEGAVYVLRTINADGRAGAKINGRSVPVSLLRDAGRLLINIHGQHDNQILLTPSKHIDILDSYAQTEELRSEYIKEYNALVELRRRLKQNTRSESEREELIETLKHRISEIDGAKLKDGEEEKLIAKRDMIRNIEKVLRFSNTVTSELTSGENGGASAVEKIRTAIDSVQRLSDVLPDTNSMVERLTFCLYELQDISDIVSSLTDGEEISDPAAELDRIESRLETISRLESKYAPDIKGILEYRVKLDTELSELLNNEKTTEGLRREINKKAKEASFAADRLTEKRKEYADKMSSLVTEQLCFLDLEKVRFSVSVTPLVSATGARQFTPNGCDGTEFLISTNPGEPLKPLSKIASGGELSRVMLALKSVLADSDGVDSIIFDEIDTGVSGRTSEKIGIRLHGLAKVSQVICITHSSQIAAIADTHYKISKIENNGRAETSVQTLDTAGRVEELSRIIGGIEITDAVRNTAKEMLKKAHN